MTVIGENWDEGLEDLLGSWVDEVNAEVVYPTSNSPSPTDLEEMVTLIRFRSAIGRKFYYLLFLDSAAARDRTPPDWVLTAYGLDDATIVPIVPERVGDDLEWPAEQAVTPPFDVRLAFDEPAVLIQGNHGLLFAL